MTQGGRYEILKQQTSTIKQDLFTMNVVASLKKDVSMTHGDFLIELVFRPAQPDFRLSPSQIQLLIGYIGELLSSGDNH